MTSFERIEAAYRMKIPDRVPVAPIINYLIAYQAGLTIREMFTEPEMLVYGTPDDVDAYCKRLIEDCAEGGGFILEAECEVPWDSKPENIHAMLKAAEKTNPY